MINERVVLAVDDEPANQRAVRRALSDDCRVLTAGSGAEALEVMACEPVALVITDQRMPEMSGSEFLAETVRLHPLVIRVVLTGYPDVDTLLEAINRNHVYHFLGKPWDARELRQVVRRGLERFEAVAERSRLLDDLRHACARAEREAEQQTRLLTLTAHELGTPLHILVNAVSLMREGAAAASRDWIETIERAVTWLVRGITQLHDAGRIRTRRFVVRPQYVDVASLFSVALADARAAARDRWLDLDVDAEMARLVVWGDRHWLRQGIDALLSNAVRFTPDGGRIRISARAEDGWDMIVVSDTGIGIAAEHLADVFEPFSAAGGDPLLHGSGRWAFGARGLGLGLAMIKGIAEAHGGTVAVESTLGLGSRFALRLPRRSSTAAASG